MTGPRRATLALLGVACLRRRAKPARSAGRWATLALLGVALATGSARAQGDAAAAEQLYKEGKALTKQGKYAEACPKFEASYKLDPGLGTLVNLADCNERIGRIATAWAQWNEAADQARRNKDEREKLAVSRRDKLEPKLPKLKVDVSNAVSTLAVYRGDVKLEPGSFGVGLPVDPGEVTVTVRRGDKILKTETVTAKESETVGVAFDLGALDREFPEEKPAPAPAPPAPTVVTVAPPPPAPSTGQKTLGYVVGGVGVAALATAGVLEIIALSKKSQADEPDQCLNGYCSPNGFETVHSARRFATIGQWVGIGGVLFTAVGATLIFTAPSAPETAGKPGAHLRPRPRVTVAPYAAPGGTGFTVSGAM